MLSLNINVLVWETVINCTAKAWPHNVGHVTQKLVFPDSSDINEIRTVECYFGDGKSLF